MKVRDFWFLLVAAIFAFILVGPNAVADQSLDPTADPNADKGWDLLKENEGIKVWTRYEEGSQVRAFRGHKVINASIDKIVDVLVNDDFEQKTVWIDMIYKWENIDRSHGMGKNYNIFDMPFPLSDRDFVFQVKKFVYPEKGEVQVRIGSVEHPKYPPEESAGVRGKVSKMYFKVVRLTDNTSDVVVESHIDPKGWLPAWAVNFVNSRWPEHTLKGLEEVSSRPNAVSDQETLEKIVDHKRAKTLAH